DFHVTGVQTCALPISRHLLTQSALQTPITLEHADVLDVSLQPASVVVMNFTLQFIAADKRDALVRRIAESLQPGGIFVLSEKIRSEGRRVGKGCGSRR